MRFFPPALRFRRARAARKHTWTYASAGRLEQALQMERDVYSGWLKLYGEEHVHTLTAANNYAASLCDNRRFEEAKALLRKTMPVARRVLGESHNYTLKMKWRYALALTKDASASLDGLYEAVTTLEETERIARRVLGGAHPDVVGIGNSLRVARAALRTRETQSSARP